MKDNVGNPAAATEPAMEDFDGRTVSRTDVPISLASSGGRPTLGVEGEPHRRFLPRTPTTRQSRE